MSRKESYEIRNNAGCAVESQHSKYYASVRLSFHNSAGPHKPYTLHHMREVDTEREKAQKRCSHGESYGLEQFIPHETKFCPDCGKKLT